MSQHDTFIRDSIDHGVAHLVKLSGENSRDHGFHDDWPDPIAYGEGHDPALRSAIAEKLALIHEEVSEALGEIRSGHDPLGTYYSQTTKLQDVVGRLETETITYHREQQFNEDGIPQLKPEGFLVELADAVIRIADLVYLVDGTDEFLSALEEKHAYNATRPFKHGRKF